LTSFALDEFEKETQMRYVSNVCLLFLLANTLAFGGAKVKMETVKNGATQQVGWVYIEGENWLRIDTDVDVDTGEPENSMIFQADQELIYMVDHDSREYLRMDKETMAKFASRMNEAMRQMEEQLAQMPEAQRKIMEDMMKKNMPQAEGDLSVEVKSMGTEGDYQKYEVWVGGEKMSEVWATSPEEVGIPANSLEVFTKMSAFYEELMEVLASNPFFQSAGKNPFPGFAKMQGFPVRTLDVESGSETHMSEASMTEFPDGFFEPPSEFKAKKIKFD
jgi:hypothetical protein